MSFTVFLTNWLFSQKGGEEKKKKDEFDSEDLSVSLGLGIGTYWFPNLSDE